MSEIQHELVEPNESRTHSTELDVGETAALSVAKERNVVFLTDDLAALPPAEQDRILDKLDEIADSP